MLQEVANSADEFQRQSSGEVVLLKEGLLFCSIWFSID
jgi:hypothetical protein